MDIVKRVVFAPYGELAIGFVTSALVLVAVLGFGAPPLILLPTVLIVGTVLSQLKSRAQRDYDQHPR